MNENGVAVTTYHYNAAIAAWVLLSSLSMLALPAPTRAAQASP